MNAAAPIGARHSGPILTAALYAAGRGYALLISATAHGGPEVELADIEWSASKYAPGLRRSGRPAPQEAEPEEDGDA